MSQSTPATDLIATLRRRSPASIDLTLARMQALLADLGSPEQRLPPVVHIAGTNGKGSVLALLGAMLAADGRRVHSYVSPPLRRVTEAIRLGVEPGRAREISDDDLARHLAKVLAASTDRPVTSFEAETAAALLAFAETPADVLLLEVGMGGRLDATNVVEKPVLTIITPVGMDHQAFLGDSLAEIAHAKAGILKRGVAGILARQEPAAQATIEAEAERIGAPLFVCGRDFDAYAQNGRLVYQDEDGLLDLPLPALVGSHQVENAGTAIAAALRIGALRPSPEAIARGLKAVHWPGRFQPLPELLARTGLAAGSELWVDGGHNPAAAIAIAQTLERRNCERPLPLHLIVGMLASRDPRPYLEPLVPLARSITGVPIPDTSRAYTAAHTPAAIAAAARSLGAKASEADGFAAALARLATSGEPVRVLITGSLHLAGAVLEAEQHS